MLWPPLAMGLIFGGAGVFMWLIYLGVFFADQPRANVWVLALCGGLALVIGTYFLTFGVWEVFARDPSNPRHARIDLLGKLVLTTAVLTAFAVISTYAALAAWWPEYGGRFGGGLTGTVTEYRIVWTLAATVLDVVALVFWLVTLGALVGWATGKSSR